MCDTRNCTDFKLIIRNAFFGFSVCLFRFYISGLSINSRLKMDSIQRYGLFLVLLLNVNIL